MNIRKHIHPQKGDIVYRGDDGTEPLGFISQTEGGRVTIASDMGFVFRLNRVSRVIESGTSIRNSLLMKTGEHSWKIIAEHIQ